MKRYVPYAVLIGFLVAAMMITVFLHPPKPAGVQQVTPLLPATASAQAVVSLINGSTDKTFKVVKVYSCARRVCTLGLTNSTGTVVCAQVKYDARGALTGGQQVSPTYCR